MFDTLFKVNINWTVFFIASVIIFLFPGLSLYSSLALIISLHQFLLLFYSVNYVIPIRYLFGFLMCLQMLIGPTLTYNGFEQYQYFLYKMQIPESEYFSYVIPAVILFILGLNLNAGKLEGEVLDEQALRSFTEKRKNLPYQLIGIGFLCSFLSKLLPAEIGFLVYLIGGFKFIGVFLLIIGNQKIKIGPLILVYGSVISSSLGEGMFHDLITWGIFLGIIYSIRYKPPLEIKAALVTAFIIVVTVIQLLKGEYRSSVGKKGEAAGAETFTKTFQAKSGQKKGLFSLENLAPSITRINQGFIVTNIIKTVPAKVPFSDGEELLNIIQAAVLPRILAPNKLKSGDKAIFEKYSGIQLTEGTSMALSSVGDAYLNFGLFGGWIFMFVLGYLYNFVLKSFYRYSKEFPVLLMFTALVFYYPIRPDCELQTIMGHLVKSCFLIYLVMLFWKNYFKVQPLQVET